MPITTYTTQWRRRGLLDEAYDILCAFFSPLTVPALGFLLTHTPRPAEVHLAAKRFAVPLYAPVDPAVLDELRREHLMEGDELSNRGRRYAVDLGNLLALLSSVVDSYYLPSRVMAELKVLKSILQPGCDLKAELWRHRDQLKIVPDTIWADGLKEPEADWGPGAFLFSRFR